MTNTYQTTIDQIIERFKNDNDFWSTEIIIPAEHRNEWLCMRNNPKHFTQSMFLGMWSDDSKKPSSQSIRLVRAMDMPDDSLRIIGRQGDDLFVLIIQDCF